MDDDKIIMIIKIKTIFMINKKILFQIYNTPMNVLNIPTTKESMGFDGVDYSIMGVKYDYVLPEGMNKAYRLLIRTVELYEDN